MAQGIVYGRPRAQVERNYLPRALQSEVDLTLDDDLALDLIAQRYLADAQPHPANQGAPVLETHLPGVNQYAMGRSSNALRYGAPLPRPASVIRCESIPTLLASYRSQVHPVAATRLSGLNATRSRGRLLHHHCRPLSRKTIALTNTDDQDSVTELSTDLPVYFMVILRHFVNTQC